MSDLPPPTAAPKPTGRRLRIALALSLALNFAVLGVIAGAFLRDGHGGPERMTRDLGFGPFAEALRPEDRKALRRALIARAPEMRQHRQQMKSDMKAILLVLRADPFDAAALGALLDGQQARLTGQLQLGQNLMRDFLIDLPTVERKAFADRLENSLRHAPRDKEKPKD